MLTVAIFLFDEQRPQSLSVLPPAVVEDEIRRIEEPNILKESPDSQVEPKFDSIKFLEDEIKRLKQFDYLNGNDELSNFEIFLQKYYGLDGFPAYGESLVESLIGSEVEWSLRINDIIKDNADPRIFVVAVVNNPVCSDGECPINFSDATLVVFPTYNDFPSDIKIGDYFHVRGDAHLFPDGDEAGKIRSKRERLHVHWRMIKYLRN